MAFYSSRTKYGVKRVQRFYWCMRYNMNINKPATRRIDFELNTGLN